MQTNIESFQSETRTEEIRLAVSERLSPNKYKHSLNVARYAWQIAEGTSVDPRKMYIAGLLHDVANALSSEEILELCERTDRYIPSNEVRHARSLHGIAGACVANEEFGIEDREILMAIAFHSGRVGMQQSEKILFLADVIDHEDELGLDSSRIWKRIRETDSLDTAILMSCTDMIQYCVKYDLPMNKRMQDSFDYIIDRLRQNADSKDNSYDVLRSETDDIVDRAMDIYLSHRIKIDSVINIRDVGNYKTLSGKTIKKEKIIRSGSLSQMTTEDAKLLKSIGVNVIIDLRVEEEIKDERDRNIDDFQYFNCPLPYLETQNSSKRMLEFIKSSVSDEEKTWYATEYMRYVSMKQLYQDILMSDDSVVQLRKIIDILLDVNTNGVLIHCSKGKDRTGIVVMLIQLILGMNGEEILNDYYASAVPYYMITESAILSLEQQNYSSEFLEKTRELLSVNAKLILSLTRWLEKNQYGTPEKYLSEKIQITPEQMELLRKKYLEA